jgi:hypothetical protein
LDIKGDHQNRLISFLSPRYLVRAVIIMSSSPASFQHDKIGPGEVGHGSARTGIQYTEHLMGGNVPIRIAPKSTSAYTAIKQHPGFHQFEIERPIPGVYELMIKTEGVEEDDKSSLVDYDPLEVGVHGFVFHMHDPHTAQHALAKMRRDQGLYLEKESKTRPLPAARKSFQPSHPMSTLPRDEAKPPRRPALAATHPNLYTNPTSIKVEHRVMPPLDTPKHSRTHQRRSPPREPRPELDVPPWQIFSDPKRLTSAVPMIEDPGFRMLKMDVRPDQPCVVSPSFMIALPFGTLIEGANQYEDDRA